MAEYNYEQSIWGEGEASLVWSSPTAVRLARALSALSSLPPSATVLEIGSGGGQFIRGVKRLRNDLVCKGCDISAEAIARAEKKGGGVEYTLSEQSRLPYADNSCNAVLVFDVLEHVDDVVAMLKEIHRVLTPDGVFYAYVPCEGDWLSLWNVLDQLGLKQGLTKKYAGHIHYFSRVALIKAFSDAGFLIKDKSYSEHFLGQWLMIVTYVCMNQAAKKKGLVQINNEDYFKELDSTMGPASLFALFKKAVNTAITLESIFFKQIPSPNVHFVAQAIKNN